MKNSLTLILSCFLLVQMKAKTIDSLEVKIFADTEWWAGIIFEGDKMPLKNGYEPDLFGTCWYNQMQPLLLSTKGELVWSDEPFRFKVTDERIFFDKAYAPLEYILSEFF